MRRKMLGGLVLAATLVITGAGSALAQPVPAAARSADTFYTPPSDLASLAPGAVIRSRTVGVPAYGIPLPVQHGSCSTARTTPMGPPSPQRRRSSSRRASRRVPAR